MQVGGRGRVKDLGGQAPSLSLDSDRVCYDPRAPRYRFEGWSGVRTNFYVPH